jgi:peptidyl-prolyl cis-trans isomerase C
MTRRSIFKIGLVLVAIMIFGLNAVRAEDKDILAKVGNKVITKAEFERLLEKRGGGAALKNRQLKLSLLNNLVQTMALGDAARKEGLDKQKDIREILELAQDNILANELIKKEVLSKVKVDEAQAKAYYEKNQAQFKKPDEARFKQIVIKMNAPSSPGDKEKAREKAEMILKKIKGGEDFAKLAKEFSEDQATKAGGGELGFLQKSPQINPFEKAAFALKPGEVSDIVETPFGYYLIKMEEKKKEEFQPFEKIKDRVMKKALEETRRAKTEEFVEQVIKEAKVTINSGGLE